MDYKEKYDELVEAARAVVEGNPGLCDMNKRLGRVRDLLPEKESEDERIRKKLYHTILGTPKDDRWFWDISKDKVLAYLEKQKEQKPTNSEKPNECGEDFDENIRNLLHDKLTWHSEDGSMSSAVFIDDKTLKDIVNGIWFYVGKEALKYQNKELSQSEWSEEDEKYLNIAINIVSSDLGKDSPIVSLLKSLHPQPHWKPSREQMEALRKVTYKMGNSCFGKSAANDENLHSLYIALEKLL